MMAKRTYGSRRLAFQRWTLSKWNDPNRRSIYNPMAPEEWGFDYWDCPILDLEYLLETIEETIGKLTDTGHLDFPNVLVSLSYHERDERLTFTFIHKDTHIILYKMEKTPKGYSIYEPRCALNNDFDILAWRLIEKGTEDQAIAFLNSPIDLNENAIYESEESNEHLLTSVNKWLNGPLFDYLYKGVFHQNDKELSSIQLAVKNVAFDCMAMNTHLELQRAMFKTYHSRDVSQHKVALLALTTDLLSLSPSEKFSLLYYCVTAEEGTLAFHFSHEKVLFSILNELINEYETLSCQKDNRESKNKGGEA